MVTDGVNVCSNNYRSEWLSEAYLGEGHPNRKGGGNEKYGKGWYTIRKRALERDGYQCRICETTKEEMGRNPDVHHIVPVRSFVEDDDYTEEDAHYLENLVSLCIGCHRKAEFGDIPRAELRSLVTKDDDTPTNE